MVESIVSDAALAPNQQNPLEHGLGFYLPDSEEAVNWLLMLDQHSVICSSTAEIDSLIDTAPSLEAKAYCMGLKCAQYQMHSSF